MTIYTAKLRLSMASRRQMWMLSVWAKRHGMSLRCINRKILSKKDLSMMVQFLEKSWILSSEAQKFLSDGLSTMSTIIYSLIYEINNLCNKLLLIFSRLTKKIYFWRNCLPVTLETCLLKLFLHSSKEIGVWDFRSRWQSS